MVLHALKNEHILDTSLDVYVANIASSIGDNYIQSSTAYSSCLLVRTYLPCMMHLQRFIMSGVYTVIYCKSEGLYS